MHAPLHDAAILFHLGHFDASLSLPSRQRGEVPNYAESGSGFIALNC